MLSLGSENSEMSRLMQIVTDAQSENIQSELLTKFETSKSITDFEIFTRICELVPLATSIQMMKNIMSAFVRKLVSLLEERSILQNAELSKNGLECVKRFWSLCSRQQNVVSSSQLFGKWHPKLIEEATPLASVFIDLFLSAHGQSEKASHRSKQLYSWLNFDLPDRAIKIALLEAECHGKEGVELVEPILSQVLSQQSTDWSNADYLLHFLLLKKWQRLAAVSDLIEVSKLIKAPPLFLPWLRTYWKNANDYIAEDKNIKGASVSQFLLDLNTDDVLDPLIDVLQMAIFPESTVDIDSDGSYSGHLSFVVDKKGKEKVIEVKGDMSLSKDKESAMSGDDEGNNSDSVVKTGMKRTASLASNSPEKPSKRHPKKTELKARLNETEIDKVETIGFFLDRGHAQSVSVSAECKPQSRKQSLSDEDEGAKQKKRKRSKDDSTDHEKDDDNSDEEQNSKRRKQIDDNDFDDESTNKSGEEVESDDSSSKHQLRPRNLAAAVLKSKHILISDPVSTSYFSSGLDNNQADESIIQVFSSPDKCTVPEDDNINKSKSKKMSASRISLSSPIMPIRSSPRIKKSIVKTISEGEDGVKSSPIKTTESPRNHKGSESPLNQKRTKSQMK